MIQYVPLRTVNNKGKKIRLNRSMLMALFLALWAGVSTGGGLGTPLNKKEFSLAAMSKMVSSFFGGGGGLGRSESPRTMFTKQYSISAMKTNLENKCQIWIWRQIQTHIVHTDMKASTAFKYETGGRAAWLLACWVDKVNKDVTPSVTLAGAASCLIQNEIH